jgi:hypothetical protein
MKTWRGFDFPGHRRCPGQCSATSLASAVVLAGMVGGSVTSAHAQDFDVLSLKPGETRLVEASSANPYLLVCNDMTSGARVSVTVGHADDGLLMPGACATEFGTTIRMHSLGSGLAMVTYRPVNIDGPGGD